MSEPTRRVEIATCDKHGIRYNAAESSGCVRCLREQEAAPGRSPAVAADTPASARNQLLLAAGLVGACGFLLFTVHQGLVDSFQEMMGPTEGQLGIAAATDPHGAEYDRQLDGVLEELEAQAEDDGYYYPGEEDTVDDVGDDERYWEEEDGGY